MQFAHFLCLKASIADCLLEKKFTREKKTKKATDTEAPSLLDVVSFGTDAGLSQGLRENVKHVRC